MGRTTFSFQEKCEQHKRILRTGGNTFGSLYIGRGPQRKNYAYINVKETFIITLNPSQYVMRPVGQNGLDSAALHYSVYRSLTSFLSMESNLNVTYNVSQLGCGVEPDFCIW
ncbi:uncharacterized protein VP01_148g20 [Puccinia sorghi]|uniref:Uncharacterized protein n=1 Tax=Puccinia sorghi TaxID=27349 RepID=A0A0L6VJF4_9BASI|nr:uncharacterized protein VP01_148g20 [Puccinia sorghi]